MSDPLVNARIEIAHLAAGGVRDEEAIGEVAWWVTGGVSLLAWTGIALLLTAA